MKLYALALLALHGVAPVRADLKKVPAKPAVLKGASAPAAAALAPEVKSVVEKLQKYYEATNDFTASFEQSYTYKTFHRTQESAGTVKFKKPAQMRWDYLTPSPRSFVLANDTAYMLDPEALTLTKSPLAQDKLSAAVTFLWGRGKLAEEFAIQKESTDAGTAVLLALTPRVPDARYQRIKLLVDPGTGQVTRSTVIDPDGSENVITFKNLQADAGVSDEMFKLKAPPGTKVVDLSTPSR